MQGALVDWGVAHWSKALWAAKPAWSPQACIHRRCDAGCVPDGGARVAEEGGKGQTCRVRPEPTFSVEQIKKMNLGRQEAFQAPVCFMSFT